MQKIDVDISYKHTAEDMGEAFCLTLCSAENDKVDLMLSEKQFALFNSRLTRSFYVRCKKEKILLEIGSSSNYSQLETIARKYYLCDCCDFADINIYAVKRLLGVVVDVLYKYPKLRGKLCFIGTHDALERRLKRLENGDTEVLNDFNLQYICTEENAKKLGKMTHNILAKIIKNHENYVATALSAFGLFDSVLLDKNDYDGYAYVRFVSLLRKSEANGYHPKGCFTPESIIYHEMGHLLDDICEFSKQKEFKEYYNSLSQDDIRRGLSEYALVSSAEFVAEAFAEYMSNPTPRPIAQTIGELLDLVYKRK